ncbi:MAG: hypothetical protein H6Q86_5534 [candidate division NC10 bacterium]|nr:hypothetical protein [candidate division NC10 bacterium]
MAPESMEDYLRRRLKVELLKLDRMRAVATFPPDLQGPPEAGHGGGASALLLEMVRMVAGERGGEAVLPRPLRIEIVLHREIPLDTPLRAEVTSDGGIWHSRILREDRPILEADVSPATAPAAPSADLRRAWEAPRGETFTVPGYELCLGCGFRNPRGAQVRFECDDQFVWKRLTPQAHFRCEDGSLFPGYHIIVGDELGWWMGALRQGECGLSSRLVVTLGETVRHGTPLLALGPRASIRTADPKGRIWQTQALIVGLDWQPVAAAEVEFAGSRAFSKVMLPRFIAGTDADAASLRRTFPRYQNLWARGI